MTERKKDMGSDLAKVDAHAVSAEEYDESPELGDEWFARAEVHVGGKKVGRPRAATRKQAIKLRLDQAVIATYRATGPGWQTRMNAALRRAAHKVARKAERKVAHKAAAGMVVHRSEHNEPVSQGKMKREGRRRAMRRISRKAAKRVKRK